MDTCGIHKEDCLAKGTFTEDCCDSLYIFLKWYVLSRCNSLTHSYPSSTGIKV